MEEGAAFEQKPCFSEGEDVEPGARPALTAEGERVCLRLGMVSGWRGASRSAGRILGAAALLHQLQVQATLR